MWEKYGQMVLAKRPIPDKSDPSFFILSTLFQMHRLGQSKNNFQHFILFNCLIYLANSFKKIKMTAVWSKFTNQLSNWIGEGAQQGKMKRQESENADQRNGGLRSSGSLSTINFNHKHFLRNSAVRSKSSENLHRIGGCGKQIGLVVNKTKVEYCQCECCPPSTASSATMQRNAMKSGKKVNMNGGGNHRFPSFFLQNGRQMGERGGGNESGYSSASPSRKKSAIGIANSASSFFFQNLRGRNKQPKSKERAEKDGAGLPPQSNASSSGASSAATTNATSAELTSGEAQKKKWWRFSGASLLPFADEEIQFEKERANQQGSKRSRRPSEPGGENLPMNAKIHVDEPTQQQLQNYLISPPKKLGPKKTKSTFAILFPHNSHLPMSLSWNNNLSSKASPQKLVKSLPNPAPPYAQKEDDGLTESANEDFHHFQRRPSQMMENSDSNAQNPPAHSPSQETVRQIHQQQRHLKRKQSSGQKLVNVFLNAGGRWRSNSKVKNIHQNNQQQGNNKMVDKDVRHQKRSRSVGANQQMRISTTMCSAFPLDDNLDKKNSVGLAFDDSSSATMFGNMTFEDAHPAYWAPLGFRTPQSDAYYSCNGGSGTIEVDKKSSPSSSAASSSWNMGAATMRMDIFRRIEKIGEGSYATVWKSENRIDGSFVALKEIRLQEQEGLPFTAIREISLLRALRHANIVRLHQIIIQQPKSLILVFEYMRTDLAKYLEQYYPHGLDQFRVKVFLFQLLRGLAFCHERKILHRDLKPQNLLVSNEGELKLADFGLARAKSVPSRTYSHDVVTLWYRPPDVLLGSTIYSTSLDMWGVGCIFAEMCTGTALFPGANEVADQLERIFSVRGIPSAEYWPECRQLPKWAQFNFPAYNQLDWIQVEPSLAQLNEEGQKLLNLLLQLNPRFRISAEGAMLHKYFDELPKTLHALLPTESVFSILNCSFKWTVPLLNSAPNRHYCFEYDTKV